MAAVPTYPCHSFTCFAGGMVKKHGNPCAGQPTAWFEAGSLHGASVIVLFSHDGGEGGMAVVFVAVVIHPLSNQPNKETKPRNHVARRRTRSPSRRRGSSAPQGFTGVMVVAVQRPRLVALRGSPGCSPGHQTASWMLCLFCRWQGASDP